MNKYEEIKKRLISFLITEIRVQSEVVRDYKEKKGYYSQYVRLMQDEYFLVIVQDIIKEIDSL